MSTRGYGAALRYGTVEKELVALSRQQTVTWEWARGHNGHPFNGRAYELAGKSLEQGREAGGHKPPPQSAPEAQAVDAPPPPAPSRAISPEEMNLPPFECEEDGQFRFH